MSMVFVYYSTYLYPNYKNNILEVLNIDERLPMTDDSMYSFIKLFSYYYPSAFDTIAEIMVNNE